MRQNAYADLCASAIFIRLLLPIVYSKERVEVSDQYEQNAKQYTQRTYSVLFGDQRKYRTDRKQYQQHRDQNDFLRISDIAKQYRGKEEQKTKKAQRSVSEKSHVFYSPFKKAIY